MQSEQTVAVDPVPPDQMSAYLRSQAEAKAGGTDEARIIHETWIGILANAPDHAEMFLPFYRSIRYDNRLGARLTELVRLANANTTQGESCLAGRVPTLMAGELTEAEIAAIRELDAENFSPRERAAIRFALNFGGDHHAIDAAQWDELHAVFDREELMQLCLFCAAFLGMGRLSKGVGLVNATCRLPGQRLRLEESTEPASPLA
jgi:alkylhydroperoxidase family enzyme